MELFKKKTKHTHTKNQHSPQNNKALVFVSIQKEKASRVKTFPSEQMKLGI